MPNKLQISSKADKSVEILIYSDIGESWWGDSTTAKSFAQELAAAGDVAEISLRINSNGGSVFDGLAIANTLKAHKAKVTAYIDGLAASIASIIAIAADEVVMSETGYIMIHDPSTWASGTVEDLQHTAEVLSSLRNTLADEYARKTGKTREEMLAVMAAETWLNAKDAVEQGFADRIGPGIPASACVGSVYRDKVLAMMASKPGRPQSQPDQPEAKQPDQPEAKQPDHLEAKSKDAVAVIEACVTGGFPMLSITALREGWTMQQVADRLEQAKGIQAACAIARVPGRAEGYVSAGMSLVEVRASLFDILAAESDKAGISSAVSPDLSGKGVKLDIQEIYNLRNKGV